MKRALAIAALATVAAAHPVAPVAAAASPEHVTQAHQPVLGGGGARGSFWLADAPAKPGRHSADRWAEILLASPLSIAQGSSEWWVRQYRLVFGQGDSAISSAVGSFGVGVIGGVPRLFLLLLCTMLSIVLAVTIWSIAFEAVDYSDPFVIGAPKAAEASLAQGAPLLPLQPQPQQPLQGRLSLPPRAWPAPTGALPPPLCPALSCLMASPSSASPSTPCTTCATAPSPCPSWVRVACRCYMRGCPGARAPQLLGRQAAPGAGCT